MTVLTALREVQIPLVAAMMIGASSAKLVRAARLGPMAAGLGPTALFPMRLRRPLAMTMCAIELGLGIGLIVTAGRVGQGAPATYIRLGTGLLFLVATSALIELRTSHPDVGCGCFGDFSAAPVSGRTLLRSALMALAALSTLGMPAISQPRTGSSAAEVLAILCAELLLVGALSPELGEGLVRLGYSEPCELRAVPAERTLSALRHSKHWRKHLGLIVSDVPIDIWRELCWRYVVYPSKYEGRDAEIVFAVFLKHRRPVIHAAVVDVLTGHALPWPLPPADRRTRQAQRAFRMPGKLAALGKNQ